MALTTVQFLRNKQLAYGHRLKPVHVVTDGYRNDKWETACGVSLLARVDRMERGWDTDAVTCGECRAWLDERGLA